MPRNKYAEFSNTPFLKRLISYPVIGIAIHWIFQGLLYMDRTERIFKLSLDGLLILFFQFLLKYILPIPYNWFLAFLIAHTINFFFNSHLWTLLKHYGLVYSSKEYFTGYSGKLFERFRAEPAIIYAAVYGSWARGEWSPYSDLDVRVVHGPGLQNGVKACSLVLFERTRALFNRFPLDIYVLDSFLPLAKLRPDEEPKVIKDCRKK